MLLAWRAEAFASHPPFTRALVGERSPRLQCRLRRSGRPPTPLPQRDAPNTARWGPSLETPNNERPQNQDGSLGEPSLDPRRAGKACKTAELLGLAEPLARRSSTSGRRNFCFAVREVSRRRWSVHAAGILRDAAFGDKISGRPVRQERRPRFRRGAHIPGARRLRHCTNTRGEIAPARPDVASLARSHQPYGSRAQQSKRCVSCTGNPPLPTRCSTRL